MPADFTEHITIFGFNVNYISNALMYHKKYHVVDNTIAETEMVKAGDVHERHLTWSAEADIWSRHLEEKKNFPIN